MKTIIYCLFDENETPFYVGKTNDLTLKGRFNTHKKIFGKNISICEIDCVNIEEWKIAETFWIEQFRQWGFILKNKNKGGGGLTTLSDEHKMKISISKKGKIGHKLSEEHKQKLREINLGSKRSKETKELMSKQRKGKTFSEEYRKKLSDAAKKKTFTQNHRLNIGKTSLGRTKSDEIKKQISEKLKGIKRKPMSDEHKEKIRQSLLIKNR